MSECLYTICLEAIANMCNYSFDPVRLLKCPNHVLNDLIKFLSVRNLERFEKYFEINDRLWEKHLKALCFVPIDTFNKETVSYKCRYFENLFTSLHTPDSNLVANFDDSNRSISVLDLSLHLIEKHNITRNNIQTVKSRVNQKWDHNWDVFIERFIFYEHLWSTISRDEEYLKSFQKHVRTLVLAGLTQNDEILKYILKMIIFGRVESIAFKMPEKKTLFCFLNAIDKSSDVDEIMMISRKYFKSAVKCKSASCLFEEEVSHVQEEDSFVSIPKAVSPKTNVSTIHTLGFYFLHEEEVVANIIEIFYKMPHLKNITVAHVGLPVPELEVCLLKLICERGLESLSLNNAQFSRGAVGFLHDMITYGPADTPLGIEQLRLEFIRADNPHFDEYTTDLVSKKSYLKKLIWSESCFTVKKMEVLNKLLSENTVIESIELKAVTSSRHINVFLNETNKHQSLRLLKLKRFFISSTNEINALLSVLENNQLNSLSIDSCEISTKIFTDSRFQKATNLRNLSLSSTLSDESSVQEFMNTIESLKILGIQTLDLSHNSLSLKKVSKLCDLIHKSECSHIRRIDFSNNNNNNQFELKQLSDLYKKSFTLIF